MSDVIDVVVQAPPVLIVDVIAPSPPPIVEVIAPPPAVLVVEIADYGSVPIGFDQLPVTVRQVPLSFPVAGKPLPGGVLYVPMPWAIIIPANLAGTVVYAMTPATADTDFALAQISGGVRTDIGVVTFLAGGHTDCTVSGSGGQLAAGDVLEVTSPATQDVSLADIGITFLAERV